MAARKVHSSNGNGPKLTSYRRKDIDKVIVRRKSGPTKQQVDDDPKYVHVRRNSNEFVACTRLTAMIRDATAPVLRLGDTMFTGALNGLAKKIQGQDGQNMPGERNIWLSRNRQMITGFNYNEAHIFDHIVRFPVAFKADRDAKSAEVTIPSLMPGVQLHLPWKSPFFRFVISLGAVNDVLFADGDYDSPDAEDLVYFQTGWHHEEAIVPETATYLQLQKDISPTATLLLAVGVETGRPDRFGEIEPARYEGAAKIQWAF